MKLLFLWNIRVARQGCHPLFRSFPLLVLLLVMAAVISAATVHAYASEQENTQSNQHVYDKAGVLSTSEQKDLEQMCIDYGTEAGIDILVLTHDDRKAPDAEIYIEDFEDRLPAGDRVYLIIDLYNRDIAIQGYGKAETYIHSKRGDAIIRDISPDLSDGNYYDACLTYIKRSAAYMIDDSELNYDHNYTGSSSSAKAIQLLTNVWFQLLAAVIIGVVTVSVMAYHSGGRMTAGSSNYLQQNDSGLIGRRDDYIRTQVTRVRKPKNENSGSGGGFNSGGFRGGTSSGGRSHSSSRGKF